MRKVALNSIAFVSLSINILHATMSDSEDFVIAGLPAVGPGGDSGDDFVLAGPAGGGGGGGGGDSSDSDMVMAAPSDPVEWRRLSRNRNRIAAQTSGSFWSFACTLVPAGGWSVFGVTHIQWQLTAPGGGDDDLGSCGSIVYTVLRKGELQEPVVLPADFNIRNPSAPARALIACRGILVTSECGGGTVDAFLRLNGARCECIVDCTHEEEVAIKVAGEEGSFCLRNVAIRKRSAPVRAIADFPSKKVLRRWREEVRDLRGAAGVEAQPAVGGDELDDPLLFLPKQYERRGAQGSRVTSGAAAGRRSEDFDPVRLVLAINVAQHLRDVQFFQTVVGGCSDYLGLESDRPIEHNPEVDPSRWTLQRAIARADVVSCSLTRRQFRAWRKDDMIKSIHIYSDASPVVGFELQGMVLDVVLRDGSMTRFILPGSTLAYGHQDTFAKGVALVWAMWLIAGPTEADLEYVCSKVRSLTTDFGVEVHLLEMPDITRALIAWIGGKSLHQVAPMVQHESRMFSRALRMAGWSHTLGNIMKAVALGFDQWPVYQNHLRALVHFFHVPTYRQHIARRLSHIVGMVALMKSFTATFAKWRYETVVETMGQVGRRRQLCEHQLNAAMFANAQDQEQIVSVFKACGDASFWRFVAVAHPEVFQRLERLRKWGMVCDHEACEELRRASDYKKHIQCPRTNN